MSIRRLLITAAALATATGSIAAPAANAAPVLWGACNPGTDRTTAGLTCDGLRQLWIPSYIHTTPLQMPGAACTTVGRYAAAADSSEQLVVCSKSGSWTKTVPWPH